MELKEISNAIYHLAECPLWNPIDNKFYWTDILEGEIWCFSPGSNEIIMVWKEDMLVGGFAFTIDNHLILCTEKGIFKLFRNNDQTRLEKITDLPLETGERCNDVTTDPNGRLIVGTKTETFGKSRLFMVEKNKEPQIMLDHLGLSNGMSFSIDLKSFFHTDSSYFKITKYHYDLANGKISHPDIFFNGSIDMGFPDGITMDSEDHLWVAFWGSSRIRRINPNGDTVAEIVLPVLQTSSLAFGGQYMNKLLITTASESCTNRLIGTDKDGNFLGGRIYTIDLPIRGRKEWFANL